jgi:hypothetical protein
MKACEASHAYLAGIVLSGAALEYILAAWIRAFVSRASRKKLTDHWTLKELNDLGFRHGLFDYKAYCSAERIRKFRNLVHPNWFAGRKPIRFTKHILEARLADYNAVIDSIARYI